jgi:hypothetical protein
LLAVLGTMVLAFSPMPANSAGTGSVSNAGGAGNAGKAGIPDASIGKPPKAPYPMRSNQHWNTPGEIGAWQRQRKWRHPEAWAGHESWQGAHAQDWETERRSWPDRGGYRGRMVHQADFVRFFGEENPFRLLWQPKMQSGYPHFHQKGNTFRMVDPYPESWGPRWYRTHSVFVDYDRGYYLHNRRHPGEAVAVMVVQ